MIAVQKGRGLQILSAIQAISESNQIQQFIDGPNIFSVSLTPAHSWPVTGDETIGNDMELE